jgi:hypothetical protein
MLVMRWIESANREHWSESRVCACFAMLIDQRLLIMAHRALQAARPAALMQQNRVLGRPVTSSLMYQPYHTRCDFARKVKNSELTLPFLFPLWYAWNATETLSNLQTCDWLVHISKPIQNTPLVGSR